MWADLVADLNLLQKRCNPMLLCTYWTNSAVSFLFGFIINPRADSFLDSDDATTKPSHFGLILYIEVSIVYSEETLFNYSQIQNHKILHASFNNNYQHKPL